MAGFDERQARFFTEANSYPSRGPGERRVLVKLRPDLVDGGS